MRRLTALLTALLFLLGAAAVLAEVPEEDYPGKVFIDEMFADQAKRAEEYAPKVITLKNGVQVQRTPNENFSSVYHNPGVSVSYNTYFLDADNRGCAACHPSMNDLLNNMLYDHVNMANPYGMETSLSQCIDCHSYSPGYVTETYGFGTLIHGIHTNSKAFTGDCMTCHTATGNGEGMKLWDLEKYNLLRGILPVADVKGEFTYTQEKTVTQEETFSFNWMYYSEDYKRYGNEMVDAPLDPEVAANWPISVSGCVDTPYQTTLGELIKEIPSVTTTMTMHCTINPNGGPLLSNCNITGIPLNEVLKKAGVQDRATILYPTAIDGFTIPTAMSLLEDHNAYLVYEIDGKPLRHILGYPVQIWIGGAAASSYVKQVTELKLDDTPVEDVWFYRGWAKEGGGFYNKPSVGIANIMEGQIVETGKPFTFEGFADAYELHVQTIEFSMDQGATWTSFDVSDADNERWIYWYFTVTPENPGSYVLQVRATAEGGLLSDEPTITMITAK
ncbi:MAG: molybdopterin-dependent oxidoreductase [Eubacteriales bacterium]|nr:molybdopterin-dependent oxidoreductase [Eubacteriales bacterium]